MFCHNIYKVSHGPVGIYESPSMSLFLTYKYSETYRNHHLSELSILLPKASYSKELASLLNLLLIRIQNKTPSLGGDAVDTVKTYCNRVGYLLSLHVSWS